MTGLEGADPTGHTVNPLFHSEEFSPSPVLSLLVRSSVTDLEVCGDHDAHSSLHQESLPRRARGCWQPVSWTGASAAEGEGGNRLDRISTPGARPCRGTRKQARAQASGLLPLAKLPCRSALHLISPLDQYLWSSQCTLLSHLRTQAPSQPATW